jgi:hypothetical protein
MDVKSGMLYRHEDACSLTEAPRRLGAGRGDAYSVEFTFGQLDRRTQWKIHSERQRSTTTGYPSRGRFPLHPPRTSSRSTIWRWLEADAIRPWYHRSWLFPRDPAFETKAGRIQTVPAADDFTAVSMKAIPITQSALPGKST